MSEGFRDDGEVIETVVEEDAVGGISPALQENYFEELSTLLTCYLLNL